MGLHGASAGLIVPKLDVCRAERFLGRCGRRLGGAGVRLGGPVLGADVKIEGKNVQFFGDQMLNNNGPSGSPANSACMAGAAHPTGQPFKLNIDCKKKQDNPNPEKAWDSCMTKQLYAMVKAYNDSKQSKEKVSPSPSTPASGVKGLSPDEAVAQNQAYGSYCEAIGDFTDSFSALVKAKGKDNPDVVDQFHDECQHKKWSDAGGETPPSRSGLGAMSPDHGHPVGLGGAVAGPLKWADSKVNESVGRAMAHDPAEHPGPMEAHESCKCDA